MIDVNHGALNMHPLPMCGKTLDPTKHCNIDFAKERGYIYYQNTTVVYSFLLILCF